MRINFHKAPLLLVVLRSILQSNELDTAQSRAILRPVIAQI